MRSLAADADYVISRLDIPPYEVDLSFYSEGVGLFAFFLG